MIAERDAIRELLRQLSSVIATALLYTPEHAQVVERLPKILDPLRQLLRVQPELVLVLLKGEVLYQGKPLEKTPISNGCPRSVHSLKLVISVFCKESMLRSYGC